MVLGSLLNLAALAAMLAHISKVKGYSPVGPFDLWRAATRPLRERNRLLPIGAGFVALIVLTWIASITTAFIYDFALYLALPVAVMVHLVTVGIPTILGVGMGVFAGLFGGDDGPDAENFMLPMRIHESEADDVGWMSDGVRIPRRSLGLIGSSGSGKSESAKHFLNQIDIRHTRTAVYDHKSDYEQFCRERGIPFTKISGDRESDDVVWSLFHEMRDESDADEIARALFPKKSGSDSDHFDDRARQLFAANIRYLRRELDEPSNADIARYSREAGLERMYENLGKYDDLESARGAINPENLKHADSVYSTYQRIISDIFIGSFGEPGDFAVRDYYENPEQYGVLLFSLPRRRRETVAPLFSHLLDRCVNEGMDRPEECIYLLDEIEFLPSRMQQLPELVSVGRGEACQAIITLQSVAQLYDTYGKHRAQSIMASLRTAVLLRLGDEASKEYAKSVVGTHVEEYTAHQEKENLGHGMTITKSKETRLEEEPDFRGDFGKFQAGECVVARQGSGYVHGRVRLLE